MSRQGCRNSVRRNLHAPVRNRNLQQQTKKVTSMKIGLAIASLALCVATSVSFAATPAQSATQRGDQATPPAKAMHCAKGEVMRKGKCVAAKPKH